MSESETRTGSGPGHSSGCAVTLLKMMRAEYLLVGSTDEQENALLVKESWSLPELISDPFLGLMGARPQRRLTATNSHHLQKRKCNTATCVTQRLADFVVRSSNTIGTVYVPTNVGSSTYGKRNLHQPPDYLPF
ncbi:LOW QUALITY PROTEIN: islet amyloid polypeptide-like [Poecilia reticulata]|uniref:LOW QUALITY PROTEIN: islet amyloid polypeptide-like n=1 Tax=Poecilia reticulata TaxID=8081 RepID=UPI0004A46946|nr:PREDICTED: LOW QUALITY PROTEIN: islet amyloid polypeptide-like [Poecilia reticulata]